MLNAQRAHLRVTVHVAHRRGKRVRGLYGVVVQQEDVAPHGPPHRLIVGPAETEVGLVRDQRDPRMTARQLRHAVVAGRAVVDDEHLVADPGVSIDVNAALVRSSEFQLFLKLTR